MTVRTLSEVRLGETTLSLDPRGTGKFLVCLLPNKKEKKI